MLSFLKQNWIRVGMGILILAILFFVLIDSDSSQTATINDPEIPQLSEKPLPTYDCVSDQMASATSPKSHDERFTITVDNKKMEEVSVLTVRTNTGKVAYHRSDTLPMFDPIFSIDGRKVYYRKPYVTTSTAVYEFDLEKNNERYITDGNSLMIITRGKYKGNLIVEKHKYFLGGGSYDWDWIVNPITGEEVDSPIASIDDFLFYFVCGE